MKKFAGLLLASVIVLVWTGAGFAGEEHEYVGSRKCKMCHKIEYKSWAKTKLAAAYETLTNLKADEIKAMGEKVGIKDAKLKDCISCHVTGYNEKDGTYAEEGVTCEACHGPGSDFKKMKVMKDLEAAKEAGLIIPTEETCKKCHNEKSPSFKEKSFNFKERRQKMHEFKNPPEWVGKKENKKEDKKEDKKEEKKSE